MDVLKSGRKRFQTLKNPGIFGQNVAKESGRSMKINNVDVPRVGVHLALGVRVGRTFGILPEMKIGILRIFSLLLLMCDTVQKPSLTKDRFKSDSRWH